MNDCEETSLFETTERVEATPLQPQRIGRYRVYRTLGKGGSGIVYLAHDEQLHRDVAIKVPHEGLMSAAEDAESYLNEARTVAGLDHPHIVPVHDIGSTSEFPCFVVSKYIEGSTLEQRIKKDRPSVAESVELVATVAETLQYAHSKGVVHRDIKPSNILLDKGGAPYIADFGLAIKEKDIGLGPVFLGTPSYMSPEQARGEGHRVDGRSDIFSLGLVLYEILTGHRAFHGSTRSEVLHQIAIFEPRPPRQWNDKLPKELERTCLKALSKRASDRYTAARDFADDLRHSLEPALPADGTPITVPSPHDRLLTPVPRPADGPVRIVPRGLSAFDEHDVEFFLELVPGPRDRNGLPDSIRFWKTRIEGKSLGRALTVGLLYGPSGCGKSSLVRAGLLPRLSEEVIPVYVEATPDDTELRLLRGLRTRCPDASEEWGLKETLAALRLGTALPEGKKVLIIVDQFEQWLHARSDLGAELTQALRQCDGEHLQCLVLVRDDFYLAVNRFFQQLEVPIEEGHNSALVDLFDPDHGRNVLIAFGRAYGRLPDSPGALTAEQSVFLDRAIGELAQHGKVISIRLTLFALMMKGLKWTPESLDNMGGTAGAGVTFLEETFSSPTAPPTHRLHQLAAREVLRALLPEAGTDIKGQMQPVESLLELSGYSASREQFDRLLHILVGELRLISPTDPEGNDEGATTKSARGRKSQDARDPGNMPLASSGRYYQLTHDFLVPAVREWLTRKQKETPAGRAELLLAERAAFWAAKPEAKQLPSVLESLAIVARTDRSHWSEPQRRMMRVVSRRHTARVFACAAALAAAVMLAVGLYGLWNRHRQEELASHLVDQLLDADVTRVAAVADQLAMLPGAWRSRLLVLANDDKARPPERLRTHLALVRENPQSVPFLVDQLLESTPVAFAAILKALQPQKARCPQILWPIATDQTIAADRRFRAAAALADLDPHSATWSEIAKPTAAALVRGNWLTALEWTQRLRSVRTALLQPLTDEFSARETPEAQRTVAASILADYAGDEPALLARLLREADTVQFKTLFPAVKAQRATCVEIFQRMFASPPEPIDSDLRVRTRSRANAAAALLLLDHPETVEMLLGQNDDPDVRTALIDLLPSLLEYESLWSLFQKPSGDLERQAILLALDAYRANGRLTAREKAGLCARLGEIFVRDESSAVHSAAEWLLKKLDTTDSSPALLRSLRARNAPAGSCPRADTPWP